MNIEGGTRTAASIRKKRSQPIRHAADLHKRDILSGSQTDFFERVARHKIRSRPEGTDRYGSSFELLGPSNLRPAHKPVVQRGRAAGNDDDIGTGQSTIHHRGTCDLTDGNLPGDEGLDCRCSASKVNQLDFQTIFFEDPNFFSYPGRQLLRANRAITHVQFRQLR